MKVGDLVTTIGESTPGLVIEINVDMPIFDDSNLELDSLGVNVMWSNGEIESLYEQELWHAS